MTTFDQVMEVVLASEGGFTRDAADPGNWTSGRVGAGELRGTKYGLSAASYPDLDMFALSVDGAKDIYRRDYWDRIAGDRLPGPLALLVFDAAVNNGVARAAAWLQKVAGTAQDGLIGPETVSLLADRIAKSGAAAICADYLALRLTFMAGLPTWRSFGGGWARRLARLPYQSLLITSETNNVS